MASDVTGKSPGPLWKPPKKLKSRYTPSGKKRSPASQYRGAWSKFRKQYLVKHEKENGWYECAACGKWTQAPEVDHVIKRSVRPDLIFDEENLQILDHACHQKKDSGFNYN